MARELSARVLDPEAERFAPSRAEVDVRDRHRPAPGNVARVIDVSEVPADAYYVDAIEQTVAEDNPSYPSGDPVVRVVWHDDLDAVATLWRSWEADQLAEVVDARSDLTPYHFPASRLILNRHVVDVPPEDLLDSPYHRRSFDPEANRGYIHSVRYRGYVPSVLTVRRVSDGFEIVDGHKRRWVAEEAGLETVAVEIVDLDDREAALAYAQLHLDSLDVETRRATVEAIEDRWGDDLDLGSDEAAPESGVAR